MSFGDDKKTLEFTIGLMCFFLSLIGLAVFNYLYFFLPHKRGPNGGWITIGLNFACIVAFFLGKSLTSKFNKR